jgi:hypothetical protein
MNYEEEYIQDQYDHSWRINYTDRFAEKYPAMYPDDYRKLPENQITKYEGTIEDYLREHGYQPKYFADKHRYTF